MIVVVGEENFTGCLNTYELESIEKMFRPQAIHLHYI
jgi:hypothetical protein